MRRNLEANVDEQWKSREGCRKSVLVGRKICGREAVWEAARIWIGIIGKNGGSYRELRNYRRDIVSARALAPNVFGGTFVYVFVQFVIFIFVRILNKRSFVNK
ncbi:hypothetical protein NPIL_664031 [Nephila pilipes]|uniref:Uncharacterized protein n=1 Tax=Nephila pilipes TaxID=299642 RepID=A0A8X6NVX0_NEPPI|nr:hypothetical protein NPIL_664031 [Nephila pilipes]